MDTILKSKFNEIIETLEKKGEFEIIDNGQKVIETLQEIEKTLEDYRFDNQRRIKESQEDIATVVLTS